MGLGRDQNRRKGNKGYLKLTRTYSEDGWMDRYGWMGGWI